MSKYQICKICVIDNLSYRHISFDKDGICAYCSNFKKKIEPRLKKNLLNKKFATNLQKKLSKSKKKFDNEYDCLIGVSGGVDSSYLVYHAVNVLKLKPLLYHVDTGWNTSIAVSNIEKIMDKYQLDLYTDVVDWNEMRDLCRSFLKAQVPYMESIQDHAIWAGMHKCAKLKKIKHILTGGNLQTECYRPPLYIAYYAGDTTLLNDIHEKFGDMKLSKFPLLDILNYKIFYKYVYRIKLHEPLNYINYNRDSAIKLLQKEIDWESYGAKHHESNFTKFFDGFWKPKKFNHDNRRGQLSSLIANKQIKRSDAIKILEKKPFDENQINRDIQYISNKLGFSQSELIELLNCENKYFYDYKSKYRILMIITIIVKFFKFESRLIN